jgi:hypothetical protein
MMGVEISSYPHSKPRAQTNQQQTAGLASTRDSDSWGTAARRTPNQVLGLLTYRNEEIDPGPGGSALHARRPPGAATPTGENGREDAGLLAGSAGTAPGAGSAEERVGNGAQTRSRQQN